MRITSLIAAVALSGCAAFGDPVLPTVAPSEPHGLVTTQLGTGAGRTHPVDIIAINGINVPSGTENHFTLAPGDYTLRLRPKMDADLHIASHGMDRDPTRELHITVQSGFRYIVAAQAGARAADWEPVIRSADRL